MKLKFFARAEHVVHFPGAKQAGQIHNYVGRQFVMNDDDAKAKKTRIYGQNRALKEGFEIDSDADEAETLCHYVRQGGLWPANEETAQAVGVPFVAVEYDEKAFEFRLASTDAMKPKAAQSGTAAKSTTANPE